LSRGAWCRLAKGIDSWRFDVAQDVGIAVAQEMRSIVGARFPAAMLLGELNGFSGSWFQAGEGFQGMMNYWYRTATLAWLAGDIDAVQMNHAVRDARAGYGLQGLLCSWNMLSSHDTPRLITSVGDAERARLALLMQFTCPACRWSITAKKSAWRAVPTPTAGAPCAGTRPSGTTNSAPGSSA
jgi:glycosidase